MKLRCFVGNRKKEWMGWSIFSTVKNDMKKFTVECQRFISVLCFGGFIQWLHGDKVRNDGSKSMCQRNTVCLLKAGERMGGRSEVSVPMA